MRKTFKNCVEAYILSCLFIFIAWVSFVPEPWQVRYDVWLKCGLLLCLALSALKSGKGIAGYFFSRQDIFFWVYLAALSCNIWFAPNRSSVWGYYRHFSITAIAIYFLFKNEVTYLNARRILSGLCLCAGVVAILGLVEGLTRYNFIYEHLVDNYFYRRYLSEGRVMSTLMHPNILGAYLIACVPAAWYLYKSEPRRAIKTLRWTAFLLILSVMLLTFSRGTIFSFMLLLTVWLSLRRRIKWLLVIWAVFLILMFAGSQPWARGTVIGRFGINGMRYGNRIMQYPITFNMFLQHPIAGIGLTNYRVLFDQYASNRLPFEFMIPESIYLMQLAEAGILGFTGFLFFLISLIRGVLRRYFNFNTDQKELLCAVMLGLGGLLLNMGTFDGFLWRTPLYLFWIFAGILSGLERNKLSSRC